ncbi:MAG: SPFH domain-containing protein, partial [Acidimicrobiales bacterium]
ARAYPYDSFADVGDDGPEITLSGNADEVSVALLHELNERMTGSGVDIIEAKLRDLAYAPEVAESMLRRQQAAAVVAARRLIVKGAVDMVRDAVDLLERGDEGSPPIPMDMDRKATFASNLMTVIASDQPTSPIVNVGTLSR